MSGISVTGGPGSIYAYYDDLAVVAHLLDQTAYEIEEALSGIARRAAPTGATIPGLMATGGALFSSPTRDLVAESAAMGAIRSLVAPTSSAAREVTKLRDHAASIRRAITAYEATDHDQSHSFLDSVLDFPGASFSGALALVTTGSASTAVNHFVTKDPELADDLANFPILKAALAELGPDYPDGKAVTTSLGPDGNPLLDTAPRTLSDLIGQLAIRNEGAAGEISVAFSYAPDGQRQVVVDIPGTKSWDPLHTSDITSLSTNVRSIGGTTTSYSEGVLDALTDAGVLPTDDVMLVGHSEGGMVAVTAARDAINSGRFNVTHVVTAGSPIATDLESLPKQVQVLALENSADVVPQLDGAANPATANITTVTGRVDHGSVVNNHDLWRSYQHIADEADKSNDASIRDFTASAAGFLSGSTQDVDRFLITRKY